MRKDNQFKYEEKGLTNVFDASSAEFRIEELRTQTLQ